MKVAEGFLGFSASNRSCLGENEGWIIRLARLDARVAALAKFWRERETRGDPRQKACAGDQMNTLDRAIEQLIENPGVFT